MKLEPYDLVAARLTVPNATVLSAKVTLPGNVRDSLQQRIEDLVARVRRWDNRWSKTLASRLRWPSGNWPAGPPAFPPVGAWRSTRATFVAANNR